MLRAEYGAVTGFVCSHSGGGPVGGRAESPERGQSLRLRQEAGDPFIVME